MSSIAPPVVHSPQAAVDGHVAAADPHPPYLRADGTRALTGDLSTGGNRLTGLPSPVASDEPATRGYVLTQLAERDWQQSVISATTDPIPAAATAGAGARYLVPAGATGPGAGHDGEIAESDGAAWSFAAAAGGWTVQADDTGRIWRWSGATWLDLGTVVNHAALLNLLWTASGHTGTASKAPAWDGDGLPVEIVPAQVAGQIGGTTGAPDVRGLRETDGPTLLALGAVADKQALRREGATLIGVELRQVERISLAVIPADTVRERGVAPTARRLAAVWAFAATPNTQGAYTLAVKDAAGTTMLVAATFDLNTLVAGTWTSLALTATAADLAFAAGEGWLVEAVSDNAACDAAGVYVALSFAGVE